MTNTLRNFSISHETAMLSQRAPYVLQKAQRVSLVSIIRKKFQDVSAVMILSTCNRTEVYFESTHTTAHHLCLFFIQQVDTAVDLETERKLFCVCEQTLETASRLLQIANGLKSSILGDQQIIAQVRQAYQEALRLRVQGSLMERTLQAVFRSHKRIANESNFRSGSQSTSYQSLKIIEQGLGKVNLPSKTLLLIGAGDIIQDLLQFLPKFHFKQVYISNRTEQKAIQIAAQNNLQVFPWQEVQAQNFGHFDAIITAVGHQKALLKKVSAIQKPCYLIDLAVPANVGNELQHHTLVNYYNIDVMNEHIDLVNSTRNQSLALVYQILQEEETALVNWFQQAPQRQLIRTYKAYLSLLMYQLVYELFASQLSWSHQVMKKPAKMLIKSL